ncbi:unnamed protein product [Hymenolepis diminuta]|uniref:Uncharacterized protein n=1 Tax=Hymenolepis diminuta TaxID=6216 RepID=A0A564Y464_HYMDI|nr:unnamed protein product [Hymenolepis diminuta]
MGGLCSRMSDFSPDSFLQVMCCPRQPEESEIDSESEMEEKPETDNTISPETTILPVR